MLVATGSGMLSEPLKVILKDVGLCEVHGRKVGVLMSKQQQKWKSPDFINVLDNF